MDDWKQILGVAFMLLTGFSLIYTALTDKRWHLLWIAALLDTIILGIILF